ncbi:biosynthetic-type acetolactate synthase large subunit [Aminicella lysinilytica]|uniref:Acetolactate synthase n=1 Tax=Aminicella lysinilytica TaxID=433323 RepID=A0A4R6PYX5_9FIRM|nr:biosynthetic-type acetolactate synthase large subunit [Aminicella lysinilytica]NLD11590.1 biosynthetic-type acetolactate synthase large subunit [Clostridiales bacterium]TDP51075.1 acetolactate synthase large subunit [Aminicella lysinilytica]
MKLTGSQVVAEVLLDHGVDTVFGYPGGTALNIYDELYKYSDRIKHILTAHEQGAAHAADGYARATGKTGVVFSTSGPGATNLVTGIATACMDSSPLVAITANVPDNLIGRDSFQEIYITGITLPITKQNYFVNKIEDLEPALRDAFRVANSGRKGPVLVDITKDVTAATVEFTNKPPLELQPLPTVDKEDLMDIVKVINNAEKPVAYIGGGCIASLACKEINDLIDKADIPVVHTLMATGIVGCDNELNLGLVGMHGSVAANRAIDQADVVIALGSRFSDRVAQDTKKWARRARIVQVDIDKSEINKNVMVEKNCVGDIKDFLTRALPYVDKARHIEWHDKVVGWRSKERVVKASPEYMHPKEVMSKLSEMVDDEAIYVTDVGQHQMWAAQYLKHKKPMKFITSGGLGTMGFGYGAAIGAKMGKPDCRIVHITGDASFHMNLNEACTAVSNDLPIITVIMNNKVLGMVYQWQTAFYGERYSNTTPERKTDFVKLADAFGAKGYRARTLDEFEAVMKEALKAKGPVWIDCVIDRDERVLPFIPGGKTVDDIIVD